MAVTSGTDPDGSGGENIQKVDKLGRAFTRAIVESALAFAVDKGQAYAFHSTYNATGGEEVWYLKNDGEHIHVESLIVSTAASGVFSIIHQTSTGAVSGTEMIGRNLVLGGPKMEDVTAFGDASVAGSVDGDTLVGHDIGTEDPFIFALSGLVIPRTQALVVRAATSGIIHVAGVVYR